MENVANTTLSAVINRTLGVEDLPLSVFTAPGIAVCGSDCDDFGDTEATFSDSFGIAWQVGAGHGVKECEGVYSLPCAAEAVWP